MPGKGPIRTGVTAVLPHGGDPFREKVAAGVAIINGYGKCTGLPQISELGVLESPILLTSTLNVPRVADALIDWTLERNPDIAISTSTVNVVVGECHDGYLNDAQGRHVGRQHVFEALEWARSGLPEEGCVGAGTGMSAFEFKAGVGTSSRRLPDEMNGYLVGALVVSNYGRREQLTIAGVPVGRHITELMPEGGWWSGGAGGSVIVVVATDAPLLPHQLTRLARRVPMGLARTGSFAANTSGDIFIAFSTANPDAAARSGMRTLQMLPNDLMDGLFEATVQATEEAVVNALVAAETMVGHLGRRVHALPHERLRELMANSPKG